MTGLSSLARLDATAQAELVARKEVSAAELVDACRARIDALNPLLRAVVTVADETPPAGSGPFAGVPFLVKDALVWPGLRWSMGSRLFANVIGRSQTPFAKRLAQGGLVCIGKSAMSELGLLASTETLLEGATHNPWDLSRSPGGSSGGSAAAVAAGIVPIAHANDGGGSIRIPASTCGVFGFKPSRGRTVPAMLTTSDFGAMTSEHCITRSVRDSARFLALTEDTSAGSPVGFVERPIARSLRIAACTRSMWGLEPDPAVRAAHDDNVSLLAALGHVVEPIEPPDYAEEVGPAFFVIAGAAISKIVDNVDQTRGTPVQQTELEPFTWALLERFETAGSDALAKARAVLASATRAYLEKTASYDIVLSPTTGAATWSVGHLSPILDPHELLRRTERIIGYTPIQNAAGCPAMSVPLSFRDDAGPIGAHFAAARDADALLLGLAYQLEEARPWRDRWPPYSIPALERAQAIT